MFDKYANFALFFHAVREEAGGTTGTGAAFHVVTHHTNGDVYFVLDFLLRGGDGIQTRRQRAQQINQRFGVQLRRREAHHVDNRRSRGVML